MTRNKLITLHDLDQGADPVVDALADALSARLNAAYASLDRLGAGASVFARREDYHKPIHLRAQDFDVHNGATKAIVASRWWSWQFRDANNDRIGTTFVTNFPHDVPVDIDILWTNVGTGSGNVVFKGYTSPTSIGDSAATVTAIGPVTVPAWPQYELNRTRLASNFNLTRAMAPLLMLDRVGLDAADTLTNDVAVLGVIISPVAHEGTELTSDGTACWFNEPRLVAHQGAKNQVYAGFVKNDGSIGVASLDTDTGTTTEFSLHDRLERDDHDAPGLIVMPDGKVKAFYTRHSITDDPIYCRTTTAAEDVTAWDAEQTITLPVGDQPCYPKPVVLGTRLYVFFRNATDHDFIYSDDNGATWSTPEPLFQWGTGWRGYVNMVANGDRVDFIANDDNPNTSSRCNLYHCYLQGGNLYRTDGTLIGPLGTAATTAQLTKVYDWTSDGDAWGWDVQLDASGNPVCVFATFPGGASATTADTNHRYKYARWDGSAWVVNHITDAGQWIPDRGTEYRHSGGLSLLSSDTSVVYLSREIDDQHEIEKWTTSDGGTTWAAETLTRASRDKQVRPGTPEGHYAGAPEVVWMAGWYVNFTKYHTRLVYA